MSQLTKINNQIFVSGMPKARDWETFKDIGIKHVVNLLVEPHHNDFPEKLGINVLHVPVKNYSPPSLKQIEQVLTFIQEHSDDKILIHCLAGLGRTGTVVACHLVKHEKMSAEDAIKHIRTLRPGSVETKQQEQTVHTYSHAINF